MGDPLFFFNVFHYPRFEPHLRRKYWIRLNTTIEDFNLPIDIWCVGSAA
jgi:hypothetical protein